MKVKTKSSRKKKRKLSDNITLDNTLENIFESIDNHCAVRNSSVSCSNSEVDFFEEDTKLDISTGENKDKVKLNGQADKCVILSRRSVKNALALLKPLPKPDAEDKAEKLRLKLKNVCQDGQEHMTHLIHWKSASFTVRIIRNMILSREWDHLKELLRIMLKHKIVLKNYVKEITYLYFLINADRLDPVQIENYFLFCFATCNTTKKTFKEFDIWFRQDVPGHQIEKYDI